MSLKIQEIRDPFSIEPLFAIQRTAAAAGIPIYFLVNPKPHGSVTSAYSADVNQYMAELRSINPELQFLKDTFDPLDDSQFGTETHLLPSFATEYSSEVGQWLAVRLSSRIHK